MKILSKVTIRWYDCSVELFENILSFHALLFTKVKTFESLNGYKQLPILPIRGMNNKMQTLHIIIIFRVKMKQNEFKRNGWSYTF